MVKVRYHRPGRESREWEQRLLADDDRMIVSSFEFTLSEPFVINEKVVIKTGCRGILYDLLDRWYNVITVFDGKGFIGYYSDIRTPPERFPGGYQATDLVLDLWVAPDGSYTVLDREEFRQASLHDEHRKKAEEVLTELIGTIRDGRYPPAEVRDIGLRHPLHGFGRG